MQTGTRMRVKQGECEHHQMSFSSQWCSHFTRLNKAGAKHLQKCMSSPTKLATPTSTALTSIGRRMAHATQRILHLRLHQRNTKHPALGTYYPSCARSFLAYAHGGALPSKGVGTTAG